MTPETTPIPHEALTAATLELVLFDGDLAQLTPPQRLSFFQTLCEKLGLEPITRPFDLLRDDRGQLKAYLRVSGAEQLRKRHQVSCVIVERELDLDEYYRVTAEAWLPDGRRDQASAYVALQGIKGDKRANAYMRCESKAKRRVTLSLLGLSTFEQQPLDDRPGVSPVDMHTSEVRPQVDTPLPVGTGSRPRPEPQSLAPGQPGASVIAQIEALLRLHQADVPAYWAQQTKRFKRAMPGEAGMGALAGLLQELKARHERLMALPEADEPDPPVEPEQDMLPGTDPGEEERWNH